jgi:23S rRNA G2445 N2-methylase RlmL
MTKAPPATLRERLRDPGFTPRVREVDALVDLLGDDEVAKVAARAIGRVGAPALDALRARFEGSVSPLRGHIVKAIGGLVALPAAVALLLAALDDADPKTRRNAAIALGHVAPVAAVAPAAPVASVAPVAPAAPVAPDAEPGARADVEGALLAAWERDPRPEMRRTVAASLGKIGTARSLPLLREAASAADAELARIGDRARVMVERTASRDVRGRVAPARSPARPVAFVALCRRGLEELLAAELRAVAAVVEAHVDGPGRVQARLAGSIDALFAARTMLSFQFALPPEPTRDGEAPAETVARALTSDAARDILATWTEGPVRYRLAWAEGGHQRAATWDAARAIGARAPELVNDPTSSTWEMIVSRADGVVRAAIAPRALVDPRFAWRRGDVPAASHPTVAAALARVAGVREDDVVWDPFAGSGGEIVERALLGPSRALFGSDLDPRAIEVARENVAAAGLSSRVVLQVQDALGPAPAGVTLIVTNPPMGRRASRTAGLDEMLDRFVEHAAGALVPRGRLAWLAPWPRRSRAAGQRAGLTLDYAQLVDMGGFDAELQRWVK